MLGRYQMKRGVRLDELPTRVRNGIRQDTRKHTQHILRPTPEMVTAFLRAPHADGAWTSFKAAYRALLERRWRADRAAFDALAELARERDVFLGCSCPTSRNPSLRHCHTWLALEFMRSKYPELDVQVPKDAG